MKASASILVTAALLLSGCERQEDVPLPNAHRTAPEGVKPPLEQTAFHPEQPGEDVYKRYCVVCHDSDGHGKNGVSGADLAGDPARLAKPDAELVRSVTEGLSRGSVSMPPHKNILTEGQIRDVIAYVRARFTPR